MTDSSSTPSPDSRPDDSTIPLVPDAGYSQPYVPPLEPTMVDPFTQTAPLSADLDLPSPASTWPVQEPAPATHPAPPSGYAQAAYQQPFTWGAEQPPAPLAQPVWNGQPSSPQPTAAYAAPTDSGYPPAAPRPGEPQTAALAAYQQYPNPAVSPLQDPVRYDYGYQAPVRPEHPNATIALVLGLVSIIVFPLAGPVAWYLGARGRREMREQPGRWSNRGSLTAGMVLGIVSTSLILLSVVIMLGVIAIAGLAFG